MDLKNSYLFPVDHPNSGRVCFFPFFKARVHRVISQRILVRLVGLNKQKAPGTLAKFPQEEFWDIVLDLQALKEMVQTGCKPNIRTANTPRAEVVYRNDS